MDSTQIRQKFLDFFEKKGHKIVPSSSLITDDPSVLFTTAGMQQFKPYYLGKPSPYGQNVASVQKCVRTSDIDEVGDESHLTFFEMLGNFSFGGYWKKEAIEYAYEFITKEMGLKIDYVSVFGGEDGVPEDRESQEIWKSLDSSLDIKKFGRKDNFWGPTGEEGPCGPTTEIYVNGVEIWNIVFNEFYQNKDKSLKSLEMKGIDTGMGLERLAMVVQKVPTVFDTDLFNFADNPLTREKRIVADHMRAAVFMIFDGVVPSSSERGYVLRKLSRRAVVNSGTVESVAEKVIDQYAPVYKFSDKKELIMEVIWEETYKFAQTLDRAIKEFNWRTQSHTNGQLEKTELPPQVAFDLFTSYGFPFELIVEEAKKRGMTVDRNQFENRMSAHKIVSRAGSEQKFKGGLAGHSDIEVRYHTATHLLHQALRDVLGKEVKQKGSNITTERLRFDFAFPRKVTEGELKKVEEIVNEKIKESIPVENKVMKKEEAERLGALHFFDQKYPDEVSVYIIGDYSKEFCGGPHVKNTGELGKFKIIKEEAISAGVRRVKATLQ